MPSLVRANIFQRKTRAAISILAVAIEVAAVLLIVGLTHGTLNEVSDRMQAVGADIFVQPAGNSPILGLGGTTMPSTAVADRLEQVSGVVGVSPLLVWNTTELGDGVPVNMWGIDPLRFESVGAAVEMLEGRHLASGYDLVVDRRLAAANDLEVGQRVSMLGHDWTIVGVSRAGIGARIFVPLATLQELLGLPDKAHAVFVKVDNLDSIGDVAESIEASLPGYHTTVLEDYAESLQQGITGLTEFNAAISSIAVVLSFLVILLAMYTSIIERTREIGILKALGASKFYIVWTILKESLLLCSIGAAGGVGLAWLTGWVLVRWYPTLSVEMTTAWMIYASVLGLIGGLLGSLYPALRAARQDAVKALRYE